MMRKTLKILHTLAACGLIGGLGCYMILLVVAPQGSLEAYAELRQSILAISNYVLLPSLALALVSGLMSMMAHPPFLDRGWVWIKAVSGILMFKGVLTIVSAKADHAATVSRKIAEGELPADALQSLLVYEWWTLVVVMAIAAANVVIGVWRPRLIRLSPPEAARAAGAGHNSAGASAPAPVLAKTDSAAAGAAGLAFERES